MKIFRNIIIILVVIAIVALAGGVAFYQYNLTAVSDSEEKVVIGIEQGDSIPTIAGNLKKNGLIKNEQFFRLYLRMKNIDNLQAATYELSPAMDLDTIIDYLVNGKKIDPNAFMITFKEGLNMRGIAKAIAENTANNEEDVFDLLKDQAYIDTLIDRYWFLTSEIKNSDIYYPLEGYLFTDTYKVTDKDVTVQDLFEMMLQEMDKELSKYHEQINQSPYTVHQLLSLASMVELEGTDADNRKIIAGIFYNRLANNWPLGSDVTTYYAAKIDMSSTRDLSQKELDSSNPYNTRGPQMEGKIPVGPIANVGGESLAAVMNPTDNDYYFFVADKNGKIFFAKNNADHEKNILSIKNSGNWIF